MLCFNETNIPRLEELKARGECNGVEGLTILGRDALRRQEPRVSPQAAAALYVPTSAIICPFGMTIALAENAAANGCEFRFDTEVQRIPPSGRRLPAGDQPRPAGEPHGHLCRRCPRRHVP